MTMQLQRKTNGNDAQASTSKPKVTSGGYISISFYPAVLPQLGLLVMKLIASLKLQ